MTNPRWERIKDILHDAQECQGEDLDRFLDRACDGDAELRAEVEDLLGQSPTTANGNAFLKPPTLPLPVLGNGEFELTQQIGEGGMGQVYVARQHRLDRDVAVKVVHKTPMTGTSVERFHREARAVAKLKHPSIVEIYTDGEEQDCVWFAMELVDGHNLRVELALQDDSEAIDPSVSAEHRDQSLDEPLLPPWNSDAYVQRVVELCADAADALQFAHDHGIVHRDVKPHNLLLDRQGGIKVVDFGIARDESAGTLTETGGMPGTPHYMSPEQVSRPEDFDYRSDIYSLGVVLYEMLTRTRPFDGKTSREVMNSIESDHAKPARAVNRDIPRDLEAICAKAMHRKPSARFDSAAELAVELRRFARGEPVATRPQPKLLRLVQRARKRDRVLLWVAVLAQLVLVMAQALGGEGQDGVVLIVWDGGEPSVVILKMEPDGALGRPKKVRVQPQEAGYQLSLPEGQYRIRIASGGRRAEVLRYVESKKTVEVDLRGAAQVAQGDMVSVPGGTFRSRLGMQTPDGPRPLQFDRRYGPFRIDRSPVTNRQFDAFLASRYPTERSAWRGWTDQPPRPDWWELPATGVSYHKAKAYAESVGKRLPTITEWRVAMGAEQPWWKDVLQSDPPPFALGGEPQLPARGGRSVRQAYLRFVLPARQSRGFGPFDMHHPIGNVLEWCETPALTEVEGEIRLATNKFFIVGTAWHHLRQGLTGNPIERHSVAEPSFSSHDVGFRCAVSVFND